MQNREIDWSYLGAFFDGEGTVGLYLHDYREKYGYIVLTASIGICNYDDFLYQLRDFLRREGIFARITRQNRSIEIRKWDDVEIFIDKILPHTILKKPQLELLHKACLLHRNTRRSTRVGNTSLYLRDYAKISLELSKFKGRKGSPKKYVELAKKILEC